MTEDIKNLPDYAKQYKYVIVTIVDGELWFYGAYNDFNKATDVIKELSSYDKNNVRFIITNDEF